MARRIAGILKLYTVGIAGCGGLGSNCGVALARAGIGHLILADYDVIEPGNLDRQYYFMDQIGQLKVIALKSNIRRINPRIQADTHALRLTPAVIPVIFGKCDVIVEAFDRKEMKLMIAETVLEQMPDTPLVMGSGIAGWGKNELLTTFRSDNLYVCGDETTETSEEMPPLAPRVGIVANMQANVVLEILLGKYEDHLK